MPIFRKYSLTKTLIALLAVFLLIRIVFMIYMPLFDPSEGRYANISANMEIYHNYLEPQFIHHGVLQNFEGKPPLMFQLGGLACKIFGINSFAVRFPSLLAAIGILIFMYSVVEHYKNEETAVLAVLLTFFSIFFYITSGLSLTDMLLTFTITGALFAYIEFLNATSSKIKRKYWSCIFCIMLALGMLTKGPIAIVLPGIPILVYTIWNKKWKDLKFHAWIIGPFLFLAICVPWFWMMQNKNADFLNYFFVNENFKRFLFSHYGDRYGSGHEFFYGMSVIWFIVINLPGVLLLPLLKSKFRRWKTHRFWRDPLIFFSGGSTILIILFWCLTPRVPIAYLLPTVPLTSIFIASQFGSTRLLFRLHFWEIVWKDTAIFGFVTTLLMTIFLVLSMYTSSQTTKLLLSKTEKLNNESQHLYFACRTPYSAHFYARNKIILHPKEEINQSLKESSNDLLIISEHNYNKITEKIDRDCLLHLNKWFVFAPKRLPNTIH